MGKEVNKVPGPEEPEQAPHSPDFVPGPKYPRYMALADDEIIAEDQPYADDASPTADSPGYIPESDLEEDPEEENNEDPEEDPTDYPTDRDDEDEEMSIRDQTPIPFMSETEVDILLAITSPPPSLLTSYSSPLPHIPSPPLPVSPPLPILPSPLPASPTHSLGCRASMI
ncbi:hypothetical protein Tco_0231220 [Tanacetum coccineum]